MDYKQLQELVLQEKQYFRLVAELLKNARQKYQVEKTSHSQVLLNTLSGNAALGDRSTILKEFCKELSTHSESLKNEHATNLLTLKELQQYVTKREGELITLEKEATDLVKGQALGRAERLMVAATEGVKAKLGKCLEERGRLLDAAFGVYLNGIAAVTARELERSTAVLEELEKVNFG